MRISVAILFFLPSCSFLPKNKKTVIQIIERIISNDYDRNKVKKIFSGKFKEGDDYISVILNNHFPDILILFNVEGRVTELVYYVHPKSIDKSVNNINCSWRKSKEYKSFDDGHAIKLINKGRCLDRKVAFKYIPRSDQYEIRWKR